MAVPANIVSRLHADLDVPEEVKAFAPPSYKAQEPSPLPDYVEHDAEVNEVGKLTAEAIVKDYETTAKSIEAMGDELKKTSRRIEEYHREIEDMILDVKRVAGAYRAKGAELFKRIEASSLATQDVRRAVMVMLDKIDAKAMEGDK